MGKIKQMDTALANQIAAGEVVERPASVVKELCENAIDAGADHIQIEVKEAGIQQIKVIDNGHGMDPEDLRASFLAHATSKIYQLPDLFRVQTLGFRGEALASITSVAKVRIESTPMTQHDSMNKGHFVVLENSELVEEGSCPPRPGTTVQVDSIFYNTPARLKHLSSLQTEQRHIINTVQDLALAYPQIAFSLYLDGQKTLFTIGKGDMQQVIAQLYSAPLARELVPLSGSSIDFTLSGYLSRPQITRTSRHFIHWMVNGRTVKSPLLTQVLLRAYGKQLMIGRYPLAFIHIQTDPRLVDVNVHPTKQTIRMSKEEELASLLSQSIQETLETNRLIPQVGQTLFKGNGSTKRDASNLDLLVESNPHPGQKESWSLRDSMGSKEGLQDRVETRQSAYQTKDAKRTTDQVESIARQEEIPKFSNFSFTSLRYVGQVHGTYLIAEGPESFYLIDQHAAQERLRYERLMQEEVDSQAQQTLLIPKVFQLDPQMVSLLTEYGHRLAEIGIHLHPFGPQSFQLESHPEWVQVEELDHLIPDLLERLARQDDFTVSELKEASIIMQSCRGAIKANHYLSDQEAEALIHTMADLEDPFHCPHGRPVFIEFDQKTIEKLFKRIQDHHQGGRQDD